MNKDEIILMKAFGTNTYIDEMLIVAADENDTQEAKRLIEAGAKVNAKEGRALINATSNNNIELTQMLIEAGADVSARNSEVLRIAVRNNNIELTRMLIEAGADVNAGNSETLRIAVMNSNMQLTKMLIEAGANVNNVWNSELGSILKTAIKENDAELFYRIIAYVREITKRSQIAALVKEWNWDD